jgi:hypothetical protein
VCSSDLQANESATAMLVRPPSINGNKTPESGGESSTIYD